MAISGPDLARALDRGYLSLFLLPTEQCNFRCTYCYEDFQLGQMPPRVVAGVKSLISHRLPTLHTLNVAWFGGEPLLAMPIIEDISEHIRGGCASQPKVSYQATITTNGWHLTCETARRLVALGVAQAQVSLDGLDHVHDSVRRRISGAPTFDRIWSNLLAIRESDVNLQLLLRIHLSPASAWQTEEVIERVNAEFAADDRFSVLLKAIARLGGQNDERLPVYSGREAAAARRSLLPKLDPRLIPGERLLGGPCYAATPNSLVVRANGRIGKCTVALNDQRNTIGSLRENGTLQLDQEKLRLWIRGLVTGNEDELSCPYSVIARRGARPASPVTG